MSKKTKISLVTLFGFLLGIAVMFLSVIETGQPELFWNVPSFYIIVGGTLAILITTFPPSRLKAFFPTLGLAFKKDKIDMRRDIETIVELAQQARTKGLMALEDMAQDYVDDKFLYEGLLMISDGISGEDLKSRLEGIMYFTKKQRNKNIAMVDLVATIAPSLGLVGTYVGLIPMLTNLDDPTSLGPMMAIELVSSFYGGVIANILFLPIAKRLRVKTEDEHNRNELLMIGLLGIHQGKNPRMLEDELLSYMDLKKDYKSEAIKFVRSKKKKLKSGAA